MPVIEHTNPAIERAVKIETADHLKPSQSDVRAIAGSAIKDRPDGKFEGRITDKKALAAFMEAKRPWQRKEAEIAAKRDALQRRAYVRHSVTGAVRDVPEQISEQLAVSGGWLPKTIWSPVRKSNACPRAYFECGHYTETEGVTECEWCKEVAQ